MIFVDEPCWTRHDRFAAMLRGLNQILRMVWGSVGTAEGDDASILYRSMVRPYIISGSSGKGIGLGRPGKCVLPLVGG